MKSSFFAALFIISILFLQQISFADAQKGEIELFCAHTDLCISVMKSDDLHGIGGSLKRFVIRTLEKAMSKAADTLKPRCPDAYNKIVSHIEDAIQEVRNGQGPMAIGSVLAAINEAFSCYHSTIVIAILKIALKVLKLFK